MIEHKRTFRATDAINDVKRFVEVGQYAHFDSEEYMLGMMLAVNGTDYIMNHIDTITASLTYGELATLTMYFQTITMRVDEYKREMMNHLEKDDDYDN